MNNSAASPTQPFRVLTQDGRSLIWDAVDSVSLLREIGIKHGTVTIRPLTDFEKEQFGYKSFVKEAIAS